MSTNLAQTDAVINLQSQVTLQMLQDVPVEIRWFGDSVLRQVSLPFNKNELGGVEIRQTSQSLINVLQIFKAKMNIGRGLSAPQIGILRQIIVVYDLDSDSYNTYVNPVIKSYSDTQGIFNEMCLSGLPLAGSVVRPWEIELEFYDLDGTQHLIQADPLLSRVLQHEVDHLNGILFVDRADPKTLSFEFDWPKFRAKNQLIKLQ